MCGSPSAGEVPSVPLARFVSPTWRAILDADKIIFSDAVTVDRSTQLATTYPQKTTVAGAAGDSTVQDPSVAFNQHDSAGISAREHEISGMLLSSA
jgi:hypothetical protein